MQGNLKYRTQIFGIDNNEIRIETTRKYYSPEEIKRYLEQAGFSSIQFSLSYKADWVKECIAENMLQDNYLVLAKK